MAVTAVNLKPGGQSWDDNKDGTRSYVRRYLVHTDDPDESMVSIRAALPTAYGSDPVDTAAVVVTRSAEQDEKVRTLWHGEVIWTWEPSEDEEEPNPLDREVAIDWTSNTIMVPAIKDKDGDAIVNSAGDYFDPPPEREVERWIAQLEFNSELIPSNIRQYKGAVNISPCTIDGEPIAAERAKIVALRISKKQRWQVDDDTVITYRTVTLGVEIRDDDDESFDLELLDQGYRQKIDGLVSDIMVEPDPDAEDDEKPQRTSVPCLLNGSGAKLTNPAPNTAVFLTFDVANLRDLSIFPGIE
jgi:hypothetical protein